MPTQRYKRIDPELRRRLVEAAKNEFVVHGYDGASINRSLEAAGIHKGSLNYYFEDKADLYLTVLRDVQDEMLRGMGLGEMPHILTEPPKDFWEFMHHASHLKVAYLLRQPDIARLLADVYIRGIRRGISPFKEFMEASQGAMVEAVRMGQEQGAVRKDLSPETIVDLLYALGEVMNRPLLENPAELDRCDPEELQRHIALQVDLFKRMVQVSEGGTSS